LSGIIWHRLHRVSGREKRFSLLLVATSASALLAVALASYACVETLGIHLCLFGRLLVSLIGYPSVFVYVFVYVCVCICVIVFMHARKKYLYIHRPHLRSGTAFRPRCSA
jgi:hypothetical protein